MNNTLFISQLFKKMISFERKKFISRNARKGLYGILKYFFNTNRVTTEQSLLYIYLFQYEIKCTNLNFDVFVSFIIRI